MCIGGGVRSIKSIERPHAVKIKPLIDKTITANNGRQKRVAIVDHSPQFLF